LNELMPDFQVDTSPSMEPRLWQDNLARSPYSTIAQTYQWSQAYLEALRDIPLYLTVRDQTDTVVAQLLLFVINEYERRMSPPYNRVLRYLPSRLGTGTRLVWSYGPVIHAPSQTTEILKVILDTTDRVAEEWKVAQIYGITPALDDRVQEYGDLYRASYRVQDWGTFVTDVTVEEDVIWNSFDNKTRNDVRRAERNLTVVEVTDDTLLSKFASLAVKFNDVKRGKPNVDAALSYYRIFWKYLCETNAPGSLTKFLLAFDGQEARAGVMLSSFNGNVTQHSVLSDGSKGNLGGPLLTWHAIKWAHSHGLRTLDLVGVNPSPTSPEEKGIYFYKSRWAGAYRTQYNLIKVLKPFKTKVFAGYVKVQKGLWNLQGITP
jgi:hypothetical protein